MDLLTEFRSHLATLGLPSGPGRALVAVSGGPDSVALLDLLTRSADIHGLTLIVAHADHGIHPDSADVAARVADLARALGLELRSTRLTLGPDASETEARHARYAWLDALRLQVGAEIVFAAHHADDQVETVLMRVLKGSGPAGLAGMAAENGWLVRPLLPFSHQALVDYVQDRGLPAWSDPANLDARHLRSWIRTDLLPSIRARLPEVDERLRRTARLAALDRAAWSAVLDLLPGLDLRSEDGGISVAGASLRGYDSTLARVLLMAAARRAGLQLGPARAARVLELAAGGESGTELPLGRGWRAEVAFGRLRLVRVESPVAAPWPIEGESGEGQWGRWRFRWRPEAAPTRQERAALTAWFPPASLLVRGWLAGDKVRPLAGSGRRLVVRCFQDARVPRRRRESWPVLAGHEDVVWIPGVCRSDALLPVAGTEAIRVDALYA
jgi:tRNA(Ile)-lysidine synthase